MVYALRTDYNISQHILLNNSHFVTTHTHQWYRKFENWINRKQSEGNSIDPCAINRPLPHYSCYRQNILLHILIKNSIKDFNVLKNNMRDSCHGSAIMKKKYVPFNLNLLARKTIALDLKIIINMKIKSCSIKQLFIENNDQKMNFIWQFRAVDLALRWMHETAINVLSLNAMKCINSHISINQSVLSVKTVFA